MSYQLVVGGGGGVHCKVLSIIPIISSSQLFQNPHEDGMESENPSPGTLALKRCQIVLNLATVLLPHVGINGISENENSEAPPGLPPTYKHFNGQWVPPNNPH